ncbi:MAG: GNAT family N-acetyltransferase [Lachnospiraceae bacterium]|nr:GNAT family N-acetyltransferase [Lachnospiraceae bacterium]
MKHRRFYLKRVCFVVENEHYLLPFREVMEELQNKGIDCVIWRREECIQLQNDEAFVWESIEQQVLYVTDNASVTKKLLAVQAPVLGYLHEGNQAEDFCGVRYVLEQPQGIEAKYFERVFRRYAGLPWSILETERCYVRESTVEDVEHFYKIYGDVEITRYTEGLFENSVSEKAYIQEYAANMYAYYEFGIWTVILKETGEVIGRAGLSVREGFELPELGYVLGVPWQGQGLAGEVCEQILQYAYEELGLEQVQILIQKGNNASFYLAKRLGFIYERSLFLLDKEYLFLVKNYTNLTKM